MCSSDVQPRIRLDSRAELRNGGSVIGEPVVYIESGTLAKREVVPGDTLRAAGNPDLEIAASKVATSMEQLPVLIADSKTIMANAKTAGTRMSAVLAGGPGSGSPRRRLAVEQRERRDGKVDGRARVGEPTDARDRAALACERIDGEHGLGSTAARLTIGRAGALPA